VLREFHSKGLSLLMLVHGGRLRQAAQRYGIPPEQWLDLSTGINPNGWPAPPLPAALWQRLPEEADGLEEAAQAYYETSGLLAVAGSQAAIQALPWLRGASDVAILHPGYAEHAAAWAKAGHRLRLVTAEQLSDGLPKADVLVLIQPNNPTGQRFDRTLLLDWHDRLAARGGWLVVDEAFIDATPEQSLATLGPRPGLVVLRSLGKFFGLAGARVGFVLAEPQLREALREALGPWTIATPARWLGQRALADRPWQSTTRRTLPHATQRLADLLTRHSLAPSGGCALFQWVATPRAPRLHDTLAREAVLARLFTDPPSLRFGLPGDASAWIRLEAALGEAARRAEQT
jgi:L-threonine-O-3-phosphate decarboxylase